MHDLTILSHGDMYNWAEEEVRLAAINDDSYGKACYNSALKAFMSLTKDGHSGCSIGITKSILNRLIEGRPLSPIEDVPEVWNDISEWNGPDSGYIEYQCKRMSSLFKKVYSDGRIEYSDVDQFICFNVDDPDITYSNGFNNKILRETFPITMPYLPQKSIKVKCDELLINPENGDYDTIAILEAIMPDGEKISINRFFKEDSSLEWGMVEISEIEYRQREAVALNKPVDAQMLLDNVNLPYDKIGTISDGHHTFDSLYRQRLYLTAALFNTFKDLAWKSKKHADGKPCFGGGWCIVGIDTPNGQYTYHYKEDYYHMFEVQELETAPEWDGHTDKNVDRLLSLTKNK